MYQLRQDRGAMRLVFGQEFFQVGALSLQLRFLKALDDLLGFSPRWCPIS
jgi:hypothetical protein